MVGKVIKTKMGVLELGKQLGIAEASEQAVGGTSASRAGMGTSTSGQ